MTPTHRGVRAWRRWRARTATASTARGCWRSRRCARCRARTRSLVTTTSWPRWTASGHRGAV